MRYEDFDRTPEGDLLTRLFLTLFRLHSLVLAAGDRLGADQQLSSARFLVLGPISLEERGLTVPQIARRMGLTRQSVHSTVDRLVTDGLVEWVPNIDHRRSHLVRLTERGREQARIVQQRHATWANRLAQGLDRADLQMTVRVLEEVARRLEDNEASTRAE